MDIFQKIRDELRRQYDSGATYKELSKRSGISLGHVGQLLNGTRKIEAMSVETLLRLFPAMQIELEPTASHLSEEEEQLLELFRQLPQKEKLAEIVAVAQRVATVKSARVAAEPAPAKIG